MILWCTHAIWFGYRRRSQGRSTKLYLRRVQIDSIKVQWYLLATWPEEPLFNKVVSWANGLFIFIRTFFLALGQCEDPKESLETILKGSAGTGDGQYVHGRPICQALPVNRTPKLLYISYYIFNFGSMYKIWGKLTEKCALCIPFNTTCGQSLADCSLGQFMMVFWILKNYINSFNNLSICFALYSASSSPSSSSHSSLSPTKVGGSQTRHPSRLGKTKQDLWGWGTIPVSKKISMSQNRELRP